VLIVLDTNVLISALITPFGNAARILDMILIGGLQTLYDDRILSEYREVLSRPKFGFEKKDVEALLSFVEGEGFRITAMPLKEASTDEDDVPFIEVAISGETDALITGNKRHFAGRYAKRLKIMTTDEFLKFWRQKKTTFSTSSEKN